METNNIITQILSLKKSLTANSLTVIERDLIKKQLLECYELLVNDTVIPTNNPVIEKTSPPEPVQQEVVKAVIEKEEINPFVAVIEEEVKQKVKQEVIPPVKTPPLPLEKEEESSVGNISKKAESESINEHFENDGGSLNDRFQLSVNKGLNERTTQGDLKKLIDFNRQFVFIQELFNNDATAYMKTIENLNNSSTLEDAFAYLNKEIVHFYKWRPELQSVKLFEKLVRQKFGA